MARDSIRGAGCEKLTKRQKELRRAKKMKKNLPKELNAGLSLKQIQEKYKLSKATVYRAKNQLPNDTGNEQSIVSGVTSSSEKTSSKVKGKSSERVHKMKEEFMSLHNNGKTIPEIATMFHLHYTTVYDHLEEIAKENGVDREDLLKVVQAPKTRKESKKIEGGLPKKNEDMADIVNQLTTAFSGMHKTVDSLVKLVDGVIQGEENEHE